MSESEHFSTIIALSEIDDLSEADARKKFFAYRTEKIVESGLFDDDKWILSDERNRCGFDFSIDENAFKNFGLRLNMSLTEFKRLLKIFIVNNLGVLALVTLQHIILSIKRATYATDVDFVSDLSKADVLWLHYVIDFFSVLPSEGREEKIDELLAQCEDAVDQSYLSGSGAQRSLATFESYFRFHDILKKFWEETKDEEEKLFYFPVWLWWNITGVVPTRPHEFILTPRNCLEEVDGKYYFTMRKNKVKGSKKTKGYKLKEDYQIVKYQIPESLANEIKWYIHETEPCRHTDINTLLVTQPHYHMWERSAPYTSRYFTYTNLVTCLRYFYKEIVQKRYGFHVLIAYNQTVLSDIKDIEYIHLGDTRHIALINLIAEGASPIAAMMLAGHDNPEMSAHYYSNISTLIECRVHRQYKKMLNGEQVYALSSSSSKLCVGESIPCEYGGYCYSARTRNGDYSECYKVTGPAGEMGYCPNCDYYRGSDKGFYDSKEPYTKRIEIEGKLLSKIVKQVRHGRGDVEDIISILNRLNGAAYSYERYLLEKTEAQDGKKEDS